MRAALHRAWHSPRSGPVILVLVGLPLLGFGLAILAFPILLAIGGVRALSGGPPPFGTAPAWYPPTMLAAWAVVLALGAQAWRNARANRGLDAQIAVRQRGRAVPALGLATRLHGAIAADGVGKSAPIREDYGAGFWLTRGRDRFWLAVSAIEDGEAVLSLAYDPGPDLLARLSHRADRALFARLEQALREAVAADPGLAVPPG